MAADTPGEFDEIRDHEAPHQIFDVGEPAEQGAQSDGGEVVGGMGPDVAVGEPLPAMGRPMHPVSGGRAFVDDVGGALAGA